MANHKLKFTVNHQITYDDLEDYQRIFSEESTTIKQMKSTLLEI